MSNFQSLKLDRLHQLINVNLTISENYDNFDVVLQRLLHAIEIITDCEATSFLFYDYETKNLKFRLASGKNTHELIGLVVPNGKGVAHKVAREKKGFIVNKMEEIEDFHFMEIDKKINFKTVNLMAFPMLDTDGKLIGVIEACNKKNNQDFTNEDFQILLIFCQQAEKTLQHALKTLSLNNQLETISQKLDEYRYPDFIYGSKEMEIKFNFAKKVAPSNSHVLIYGELGTGKTNFATQIHKYSNRSKRPIEFVNCSEYAQLDKKNQYISIFGANKNNKLGIKKDIAGILEKATEGTVIFQEIGYLPLAIQEQLITFTKYNTIYPYNSEVSKTVHTRIIATTSKKIEKLVELHKFSEELYYQLNSLNIFLPPLRLRLDDIQPLAQYFFKKCCKESQKIIHKLDSKIFYILKKHDWPNNITELYNIMQKSVWSCNEPVLMVKHLSLHLHSHEEYNANKEMKTKTHTLQDAINDFKKQYIYKTLLYNNWNHTKTAKVLDIQRSYLSKLVKNYNLKTKTLKDINVESEIDR